MPRGARRPARRACGIYVVRTAAASTSSSVSCVRPAAGSCAPPRQVEPATPPSRRRPAFRCLRPGGSVAEGLGTREPRCKLLPDGSRGAIAQVIGLRLNRGPASRGCRCERMTPGQKKHRGMRRTSNPEPTAVGSTAEFISRQCFHQCGRSFRDNADDLVSHRVRHFPPLCKFRELQSAGAPGKPCCQVCQCDLGFGAW